MKITHEELIRIVSETNFKYSELEGVEKTRNGWRLGHIELYENEPMFYSYRYICVSHLSDTAVFRIAKFDVPKVSLGGYAAIFHDFDSATETEETELGWVKPERKTELEEWVRFMNRHIAKLLKLKKRQPQ